MRTLNLKKLSVIVSGITLISVLGFININKRTGDKIVKEDVIFKIAEKRGHSGKANEKINIGGIDIKIDRLIYDQKLVEYEVSYKEGDSDNSESRSVFPGSRLILEHEGEKEEIGTFAEISYDGESKIYNLKEFFYIENGITEGDKVSILFQNREGLKEELKLEIDSDILQKEMRSYPINEELKVEEVDIGFKELEVYPLKSYIEVVGKSHDDKWSFGGLDLSNTYIKDHRGNRYKTYISSFLDADGNGRRLIFDSPYFKSDQDLELIIGGIYLKNKEMSTINIKNNENYDIQSEYNLDIDNVKLDSKGRIRGFDIVYDDERLTKNKFSNICFEILELRVGDEKLENNETYKVRPTLELNDGDEVASFSVRIDILVEGEVKIILTDFLEYRKINKIFKIKEAI